MTYPRELTDDALLAAYEAATGENEPEHSEVCALADEIERRGLDV